jgi:hypothetical protein
MSNQYLKKAQKEYNNLLFGKIPVEKVSEHINDIREYMRKAGFNDLAGLDSDGNAKRVEDRLASEQQWADRVVNVDLARWRIKEMRRTGQKHCTSPHEDVVDWARELTIFPKAGIDTTPFTDGRPAPSIDEMDAMVKQAEEKLAVDAKARAVMIASWGKQRY